MSGRQKIMTQPIVRASSSGSDTTRELRLTNPRRCAQNLIFRYLQSKAEVEIWLYEQTDLRIRGRIIVRAAAHPLARSAPARSPLPAALSRS